MKRKVIVGLCTSLLALSLVGCTSSDEKKSQTETPATETSQKATETDAKIKDGTYEVETKDFDDNGGKARVSVKVEGGKIVEAKYNEFTEKGDKRDDEGYNKMMEEKAGTSPSKYEVELEKQVMNAQSAEIDGVTGATGSSTKAKTLFAKALENAAEGKTEKEVMDVK